MAGAKVKSKDKKLSSKLINRKPPKDWEVSDISESVDATFLDHCKPRSLPELIQLIESNKDIQVEARVLFHETGSSIARMGKLTRDKFLEAYKKGNRKRVFRESVDIFLTDSGGVGNLVGSSDFTPLLGGPFNKQLYYYDYLKMHAQAFYAYNHDPILHRAVSIIRDFVLGKGWKVSVISKDQNALPIWKAFEEVNDLESMMDLIVEELSIYGEIFQWWLPNNETRIAYNVQAGQEPPKGIIPRVRLVDPSVIWEIVTYPEDIKRVLFYQWIAPTQYQMFTGTDKGKSVPGTKFIYQQIAAPDMDHYKINCRSNEKRGRSDLFSSLGYAKRLRDSVNYSIIGMQKAAAWSIDTTIEGSEDDVNQYIQGQQEIGTIPNPGSEFVHTDKIKREYMSNEAAARGNNSSAFDWCFSMVCMGLGIPQQYFGTHLSGGGTRGNALVATEPVVKAFETRRTLVERIIKNMGRRLFKKFNIEAELEITFPELVTQDRSAKLKDLATAEQQKWVSKKRSAAMAAKELGVTEYNYEQEQKDIAKDPADSTPLVSNPLTGPGLVGDDEPEENSRADNDSKARDEMRDDRGY